MPRGGVNRQSANQKHLKTCQTQTQPGYSGYVPGYSGFCGPDTNGAITGVSEYEQPGKKLQEFVYEK